MKCLGILSFSHNSIYLLFIEIYVDLNKLSLGICHRDRQPQQSS